MKTAINIDITYDQVLSIVKKLPPQQKIKLSRELEKEGIRSKLLDFLKSFKTDELSLADITKETEAVRQKIYDAQKKR